MNGDEPEDDSPNPEKSGPVSSGELLCENETQKCKCGRKIFRVLCVLWVWLVEFIKPANVVVILLFVATMALWCATNELVKDTRHSAHKQLRAYVSVKPIRGVTNFGSDLEAETEVIIKNSGQTPALKLRHLGILFPRQFPLSKETDLNIRAPETNGSIITLHPGESEFGTKFKRKIEPLQYQAIQAGIGKIYVFGKVDYEDVFGASHWTRFCYYFDGTGPSLPDWQSCPRNNEIDENE
jgi:hypothetical protein